MLGRIIALVVFLGIIAGIIYAVYRMKDKIEILSEFFEFLKERKLWWISPIVIILIVVGVLIMVLEAGALSSVLYTLF